MSDLVSILIPAYNAEEWIKETIESALAQTWSNTEIIVVDDGSTDHTGKILKNYESKSVKIITQVNMGAPSARNTALAHAQGDYIQWLDHDDLLAPDKISNQLGHSRYDRNDRVLLSASFGRFYYRKEKAEFRPNLLWKDLEPIEYFLIKFKENMWLHTSVWLVSRKLTDMAGPWLELKNPDDDGEYFCRVVAACEKVLFVQEAESYWRIGNSKSMGQNRSNEAIEAYFLSAFKSIEHFRMLEDSERTRDACMTFLQNTFDYLCTDEIPILENARNVAADLGGMLVPPRLRPKYLMIEKFIGRRMAKKVQDVIPQFKTMIAQRRDKIFYQMSSSRTK